MSGVFDFERSSNFRTTALEAGNSLPFGGNSAVQAQHILPIQAFDNELVRNQIMAAGQELGQGFSVNDLANALLLPNSVEAQNAGINGNPPVYGAIH